MGSAREAHHRRSLDVAALTDERDTPHTSWKVVDRQTVGRMLAPIRDRIDAASGCTMVAVTAGETRRLAIFIAITSST